MAADFNRFIQAFMIFMKQDHGCKLLDNAHYRIVNEEETITEFFKGIWSEDFEAFIDNFVSQHLLPDGMRLVACDNWLDVLDYGLIRLYLLIPYDKC